jgi:succinate dehydrogenase/fumarate reductase flavoprotein subunit
MTNGNALVGRMLLGLMRAGVPLVTHAAVVGLMQREGRVVGVHVLQHGRRYSVEAAQGVVLAGGGFPSCPDLKRQHYRHDLGLHQSLAPPGNTGDGLRLASTVGAGMESGLTQPAAWAPVSMVPHPMGHRPFPHFGDKGRPGVLAVDEAGGRFVNESDSYHAFVAELLATHPVHAAAGKPPAAWLLTDHRALRRYGLGAVRPSPSPIGKHLQSGYLVRADNVRALARAMGVDIEALVRTVAEFNDGARRGADPKFGRGLTLFNRRSGDPACQPNPSLAPLESGPYYAVRVYTGDIGTFVGLRTDAHARVLSATGEAIPGLYAAGNDASSMFGGDYPAAGITLGPALTFGYLAALHASGATASSG